MDSSPATHGLCPAARRRLAHGRRADPVYMSNHSCCAGAGGAYPLTEAPSRHGRRVAAAGAGAVGAARGQKGGRRGLPETRVAGPARTENTKTSPRRWGAYTGPLEGTCLQNCLECNTHDILYKNTHTLNPTIRRTSFRTSVLAC